MGSSSHSHGQGGDSLHNGGGVDDGPGNGGGGGGKGNWGWGSNSSDDRGSNWSWGSNRGGESEGRLGSNLGDKLGSCESGLGKRDSRWASKEGLEEGSNWGNNWCGSSWSNGINETILVQIFRETFKVNRSEAFGGLDKVANQGGQGASLGSFDNSFDERDLGGAASSSQEGGEDNKGIHDEILGVLLDSCTTKQCPH